MMDQGDPKETTTIRISMEVWQYLVSQKKKPSETFDEVLRRLLKLDKEM